MITNRDLMNFRLLLIHQEGFCEHFADKMVIEMLTGHSPQTRKVLENLLFLYFEGKIYPRWDNDRGTVWRDINQKENK